MIDPVSEILRGRRDEPTPWAPAVAAALALHLAVALATLVAPAHPRRPLTLPSVRVRPAVEIAPATTSQPAAPVAAPPAVTAAPRTAAPPAAPRRDAKPRRAPSPARSAPAAGPVATADTSPPSSPVGSAAVQAGGISVGAGTTDASPAFPYQYYLDRLLSLIQGNWFRPAVPPGTSCRVRCRISRAGTLLEAGIEASSGYPAYDRAALRAVYAGAPYPPLPEAFGDRELTLHLEFGP